MNMDALDDAIKACESAVKHGYYYGNNLAIFNAIGVWLGEDTEHGLQRETVKLLQESFINVISTIYSNKDPKFDYATTKNIIAGAILNGDCCFDLNTEEYSDKIINSVRTDIEILRGAISIVGTIMSANQYISSEVKAPTGN
jgi:hypothetical protein